MQLYTISQLEELTFAQINQVMIDRGEILVKLLKNALEGKTVKRAKDERSFKINDIYHKVGMQFAYDEFRIVLPINVVLEGYSGKGKLGNIYRDWSLEGDVTRLIQKCADKEARVQWGNKNLQGRTFINFDLIFPAKLIIPDLIALDQYRKYKNSKNILPLPKEQIKKELQDKLLSEINELKDNKFNFIRNEHFYIPDDKEKLMIFIQRCFKDYDTETLKAVVKKYPDDEEIVLACLDFFHEKLFSFASERLRNDRDLIVKYIDKHNLVNILEFVPEKFKDDDELILKGINISGYIIRVASDRIKNDKQICLLAVESQAEAFLGISEEMRKDMDLILKVMETRGEFFAFSPLVKTNKDLLIKAFSTAHARDSHKLLEATSEEFRNDKEVALAAILCNEDNLNYIGKSLRDEIGDLPSIPYLKNIDLYNELNSGMSNGVSESKPKIKI